MSNCCNESEELLMIKACESVESYCSTSQVEMADSQSHCNEKNKLACISDTDENLPGFKSNEGSHTSISDDLSALKRTSDKNEDILRKLKLVKFHKNKNDLETLDYLIKKWRSACQDALTELLSFSSKQPQTTMAQLIEYLGIDPKQIAFNTTTNTFEKDKFVKL